MQIRSRRLFRGAELCAVSLLLVAAPARAQRTAPERGYAAGEFGFSFASGTSPVIGTEVGVTMAPNLMVFGAIGRFGDVMSGDIQEELTLIGTGIEASVPATCLSGGVRYESGALRWRPYALAGIGVAFLSGRMVYNGRDITAMVADIFGKSLTSAQSLFEMGVGVHLRIGGAAFVDAGYRYMHISTEAGINSAENGINVSRIVAGFGVKFPPVK